MTMSFILGGGYLGIEELLGNAESGKWASEKGGRLAYRGFPLEYKVSGQPGFSTYRVPYISPHNY